MKRKKRAKRAAREEELSNEAHFGHALESLYYAARIERLARRANLLISIALYGTGPIVLLYDSPRSIRSLIAYWNNPERFDLLGPFLVNVLFSFSVILLLYSCLGTFEKMRALFDDGPYDELFILARRYARLTSLVLAATIAFGLSLTPILNGPASWLMDHVAFFARLGHLIVEKGMDYLIGGLVYEVISTWFARRFRAIAKAARSSIVQAT